ncbi:fatty acyl-AMP ligase [Streptomonospora litoralis]|uniref:Long-chain-fatty-acid--AMP ligase FadD26 n=1 Tax=Streptomonospora litoralis TaxID=2498135 RepID=A0A4P6PWK2_9ACTN|nr:fatty acyl-AMP ligase [Streptomonospora litoralis]QBI52616.1 Long-chain-fatty-acid--AMP ligase FadD26 [Streptomonospora litoralis]
MGTSTLVDTFRGHAQREPATVALVACADPFDPGSDTVYTYADLDVQARRVAARLGREVEPGARVLLQTTGAEFARAFLGCLYAGLTAVPVPPAGDNRRHRERLAAIVHDTEAQALVVPAAERDRAAEGLRACGVDGSLALVLDEAELPPAGDWTPARAEGPAFLQYTSGSTSRPKGVPVSHENILANAAHCLRMTGATPADRWGGWLPMHHDFGLVYQFLGPLVAGASTVLMEPGAFLRRPHAWLHLVHNRGITVSGGPNFAYDQCSRLVTDEQMAGVDLSGWRNAVNGSEPVSADVIERFTKRFAPFGLRPGTMTAGYGLAEGTVCVTLSPPGVPPAVTHVDAARLSRDEFVPTSPESSPRPRAVSACGPADNGGFDLRIVDPDTCDQLADGSIGEVWLRGPSVVAGYWRRPEETAAVFGAATADGETGFLRTGDLGVVHGGQIHITGRIKDVLVVNGRKVYPHDIEEAARGAHAALSTGVGAAFTAPALDGAEQVVLVHEYHAADRSEHALAAAVSRTRADLAAELAVSVPGIVLVRRGQVHRTSSGKIQRQSTRTAWLDADLRVLHAELSEPLQRMLTAHRSAAGSDGASAREAVQA